MKKYWILGIILFISLVFRLINLDKSGGLWYDEAVIYSIASQKGIAGMLGADAHRFLLFPLYYIIYNLWINIFGNSDLIIRLMSVFFDMLSLVTAYFIGRQVAYNYSKNPDKLGLLTMLLYGINSTFIYYAQEAKFYSLTLFIINLIILFWLKFVKDRSDKNLYILSGLNLLLILTYTSQILLVFILFIVTLIYLKRNISLKQVLIYAGSFVPLLILSFFFKGYYYGNFDAVAYDNSFVFLMLQNFFTPWLAGLQNNILNYHMFILTNILNIKFWLFIVFPIAFVIASAVIGLKKYTALRYLFIVGILYVFVHILLTNLTDYGVLVRYTIMALPFFIVCAACGVKNKWFLSAFTVINIIGILSLSGAPQIARPDGYRMLADSLKTEQISGNCDFILPIRTDLLDKYFMINGNRYSLYQLNSLEAQTTYLTEDEINDENKYSGIKRYLLTDSVSPEFEQYIEQSFIHNKKVVLLTDRSISMFSNEQLKMIANSPAFEKYPFQFLRLSKLSNDLKFVLSKKMHQVKSFENKNWEIFVFEL